MQHQTVNIRQGDYVEPAKPATETSQLAIEIVTFDDKGQSRTISTHALSHWLAPLR